MRTIPTLLVVLAAGWLTGCGPERENGPSEPAKPSPVAVQTAAVAEVDWPSIYEATGTVRARTSAQISSRIMSYVRQVRVSAGDRVRAGQALVVLDAQDLETRERQSEAARTEARSAAGEADQGIESSRANLELAQSTYNRMKDLFDKRSLTRQEFEEATARVRVARANLEMAQARRKQVDAKIAQTDEERRAAAIQRGYSILTAPFGGIVTAKNVEPGNLAVPGAALLVLEQEGGYRLEASVEESNLSKVRLGQNVEVKLDSVENPIAGRVSEIVPSVDQASRSAVVKVDLPASPHLRSGQFGRARFAFGSRKALAAPASAAVPRGQMVWMFVPEAGIARSRIVTLGDHFGDQVEVLSGISPGEPVIAPLPAGLADGTPVEVRR